MMSPITRSATEIQKVERRQRWRPRTNGVGGVKTGGEENETGIDRAGLNVGVGEESGERGGVGRYAVSEEGVEECDSR